MSINFCHISPVKYLDDFAKGRRYHLLLAHLIESDPAYTKWYADYKNECPGVKYIMDNGAFELFKQGRPMYPSEKLIEMASKVNADYIVMSDYPTESWLKTRDAAIALAPVFRREGFRTFYCPQSEPGDISGLTESFRFAAMSDVADYIGISILNIPLVYGVEKGNKLQRFLARWHFMRHLEKEGILQAASRSWKKIHILGMVDGPNEIELLRPFHKYITSWDSSAAVWAGLNGITFDDSPTGLMNGKFEKEVDFSFETRDNVQLGMAQLNVAYIDSLCI